jgi:hypothetical protein
MNAAEDYLAETSQRDLAAGVLKQVAQDLRRFHDRTSAVERELYRDAYSWLISNDQEWPFSFLNVCQLLNLVPETVRQELLGDQLLGAFSYFVRRCGRGARKLQTFLSDAFATNRRPVPADPVPLTHALN